MSHARLLIEMLGLRFSPVGIAFRETPPPGVPRIDGPAPAGCAYWRLAAEGRVFHTAAEDHHGCPIGAHTHGVPLPEATQRELAALAERMVGLEYLRPEEVDSLPRREAPFGVAIYAPLEAAPGEPDVVIVRGNARQIMLLMEACRAAGFGPEGAAMGRPACALVPETLRRGGAVTSLGCIGNRVYTALGDDEFYLSLPGAALPVVTERLAVLARANRELEAFHRARRAD